MTEEDKVALFSGLQTIIMSVEILFSPSCREALTNLFEQIKSKSSLFPEYTSVVLERVGDL